MRRINCPPKFSRRSGCSEISSVAIISCSRFRSQLLIQEGAQNKICALVVDEAHKLSPEVLEEIRLLGNFERSDHKLLQIPIATADSGRGPKQDLRIGGR